MYLRLDFFSHSMFFLSFILSLCLFSFAFLPVFFSSFVCSSILSFFFLIALFLFLPFSPTLFVCVWLACFSVHLAFLALHWSTAQPTEAVSSRSFFCQTAPFPITIFSSRTFNPASLVAPCVSLCFAALELLGPRYTVCTSDKFQTRAPTPTSDRVCTPLTTCKAGSPQFTPPTLTTDRCGTETCTAYDQTINKREETRRNKKNQKKEGRKKEAEGRGLGKGFSVFSVFFPFFFVVSRLVLFILLRK